jgi:outer membrane receptor for ferrienterochelin and colicin
LFPAFFHVKGQNPVIQGIVLEESSKGQFSPLFGASVFWLGKNMGTTSDSSGAFSISLPPSNETSQSPKLIISYLGFLSDTLSDFPEGKLRIILASNQSKTLKEVSVEGRIPPTFQLMDPINTQVMTGKELMKAACCNLSESFETNPTVEVNYSDALTGAKQIQMLGLSGNYTLMTQENLPGVRGILSNFGMGFTPGPWVESIQVTKGIGSVANGYESMTGQINVELKKPDWTPKNREKLFVNLYGNSMGRMEINANATQRLSKNWHVATLLHANQLENQVDMNHDGFLDVPTGNQINVMNRWAYSDTKGLSAQLGFQLLNDERMGGSQHAFHDMGNHQNKQYSIPLNSFEFQGFGKIGFVFPGKKYKSIGLMQSYTLAWTDQRFGLVNKYEGRQKTYYANLIYQSIIGTTNLKFRLGASFKWDEYKETFSHLEDPRRFWFAGNPSRTEIVPGAFTEFTWNPKARLTAVLGLRGDYHNLFGFWFTPRLHVKYEISEKSNLRFTAGNGRRLANIFAENSGIMASSRVWSFPSNFYKNGSDRILPEMAWNTGLGWSHAFEWLGQKGNFTLDAYRTQFENQLVLDLDFSPEKALFYNLKGKSYSTAVQALLEFEPIRRLDVRLGYKWLDVWQTYHGRLLRRPFVAEHRFFLNIAYQNRSKWVFDATLNWNGQKRIPDTQSNPEGLRFSRFSRDYFVANAQISKLLWKKLDIYLGAENLFDFRQTHLIIDPGNPFGSKFDASVVWGPVIGRMIYSGLRFKI